MKRSNVFSILGFNLVIFNLHYSFITTIASKCPRPQENFGTQCQFFCGCKDCPDNGDCLGNLTCFDDVYGHKCQYNNLLSFTNKKHPLFDKNIQTCLSTKSASGKLYEYTSVPNGVISFYIVKASVDSTFPAFQIKDKNDERFICFHTNHLNSRYVDIACHFRKHQVDVLYFEWLKETEICEIMVIEGRRIPLIADTAEGRHIYNNYFYGGEIFITAQTSFHLCPEKKYAFNAIFLDISNVQLQLIMYDDKDIVSVTSYDKAVDKAIYSLDASQHETKIKMTLRKIDHNQQAEVYNLQLYGECAVPYYGLECDHVCSKSCYNRFCYLDGTCRACYPGWKGELCDEEDAEAFYEIKGIIIQKPFPQPPVYPPPKEPGDNSTLLGLTILLIGLMINVFIVALTCYLKPVEIVDTLESDQVKDYIAKRASRRLKRIDDVDDTEDNDNDDDGSDSDEEDDENVDDNKTDDDSSTSTDDTSANTEETEATEESNDSEDTEESKSEV